MKKTKLLLSGLICITAAAAASLSQATETQKGTMPEHGTLPAIRLTSPAVSGNITNSGPLMSRKRTNTSDNKVEALYSCAATTLSSSFNVYFSFDLENETVSIENLGGFCDTPQYGFIPDLVEAPFKDGVITIPCSELGPDKTGATKLGELSAYGMSVYLQVGKIEYDDNFMSSIPEPLPELKLYVSDDFSTIETRYQKGISIAGVIDYMDMFGMWACSGACQNGMTMTRINQGASWEISDSSLDFGSAFVSASVTKYLNVKSTGDTKVDFTTSVDSPHFTVTPASGSIDPSDKATIEVTYTPKEAGEHTAVLIINDGNKEKEVTLHGSGEDRQTDFSTIITEGDASGITWENSSLHAWSLEEGAAVNYMSNAKESSELKANFTGNKPKRITYDIEMNRGHYDHFIMEIDGRVMHDFAKNLSHTVSYIVPGGRHSVSWILQNGAYNETGKVLIKNLRIEEVKGWEGLSPDNSVSPLTAESFINIDGNAVASGKSSVMMISLNPKEDSNISFDYDARASEISVTLNESPVGSIAAGEKGTFHYDLAAGSPSFLTIKVTTPSDKLTESASVGNMIFAKGGYKDETRTFNAIVNSYLDEDGSYSATGGKVCNYPVEVRITSGGKVYLKNLLPADDRYPLSETIEGKLTGNEIHIPTWKNVNLCTLYALDEASLDYYPTYYNYRYWLVAGSVNGELRQTEALNELVLTISEDGRTITPNSDFGIWATWSFDDKGIFSFFRSDSKFVEAGNDAEITTTAESVDFGELTANGFEYKRTFALLASGGDCEYSAVTEGEGNFSLSPASGTIKAGETAQITVTFKPEKAGEFNANAIIYSDGNDITLPLSANVMPLPDFSDIVKDGKELITFDSCTEYPWKIDNNIAVSTNEGINNSTSQLGLGFEIPEGKVGVLSLKGASCAEPNYDGFAVQVDGQTVYSSTAHNEKISLSLPFKAGKYKVNLLHVRDSKDEIWAPYDHSSIAEISLALENPGAHNYRLETPYFRTAPAGEVVSDIVTLINMTDSPVEIKSIESEANFGALMPENPVLEKYGDKTDIQITFQAAQSGEYSGTITVTTSAGEVRIPVEASADYVRYIGDIEASSFAGPYVTALMQYGESDVTSTMYWPDWIMSPLKGCAIESLTFFPSALPDYEFSCPDVTAEVGETDKEAAEILGKVNDLETVMTGEMVDMVNRELTIPFSSPYKYEGGNFIFQMTNNKRETFNGHTPVQIAFMHSVSAFGQTIVSLKGEADAPVATVPYMRVKYDPSTGIATPLRPLSEIKEIRYYSTDGLRRIAPADGLNIVVTIYNDGLTRSTIMMK